MVKFMNLDWQIITGIFEAEFFEGLRISLAIPMVNLALVICCTVFKSLTHIPPPLIHMTPCLSPVVLHLQLDSKLLSREVSQTFFLEWLSENFFLAKYCTLLCIAPICKILLNELSFGRNYAVLSVTNQWIFYMSPKNLSTVIACTFLRPTT